jgi:hypothetical protein
MAKATRKIKAVTITTPEGDTLTYRDVSRVFTNGDRTVTVMKGSNVPAVAKGVAAQSVRYSYYK